MPELPEVETTVRGLKRRVLARTFLDVWTDSPKIIKKPKKIEELKKKIKGRKIIRVWRRGKNIIFDLSGGYSLLIHQKLTGHLLVGKWKLKGQKWEASKEGPLREPVNLYIRVMFWLSGNLMLALSDLRKFAKVELWKTKELKFDNLGIEPLSKNFTFSKFKEKIYSRKNGRIKEVLMDQRLIAGIGNIYSDEALWRAKIHPFRTVSSLKEEELKVLYKAIKEVLRKGIMLKGESISDYRNIEGKKGKFDLERKVYRREGKKCFRCGTKIKRKKIGGRSTYFCPLCQPLKNIP